MSESAEVSNVRLMKMFGCNVSTLEETAARHDPLEVATSWLSDAQEQISTGNNEAARQTINRAKYMISEAQKRHR